MGFILGVLAGIVVVALIVVVIASRRPDQFVVTRTATVDADPNSVYERISNFHRWPEWSPWEDLDPDMAHEYNDIESGVGAFTSWQGNRKAGAGEMTITDAQPSRQVTIDLRFIKPFDSRSTTVFDLEPSGAGTQVTWTMRGDSNLMSKIFGLFANMDKLIGADFERGLERLNTASEAAV